MHDDRLTGRHIADMHTRTDDHISVCFDREDNGMIEQGDISCGNERSLDPHLASDDGAFAAHVQSDTRSSPEFKVASDNEPAPEMSPGWDHKVAVNFNIAFKVGAFLREERVAMRDDIRHDFPMIREV